jgi:tRNA isopentenyl-2-thiomethyl-A-37 hydroxylase MiaE
MRHFSVYFRLGESAARAGGIEFDARVAQLAAVEGALISQPDSQFRFHSGPPELRG